MSPTELPILPEGLVVIVKEDCPTCELIVPVLEQLASGNQLTVFSQDDPNFPQEIEDRQFDSDLAISWHHNIETVPTLLAIGRFAM